MFKDRSLKQKLVAISGLTSALLLAVGSLGIGSLKMTSGSYDHVSNINLPNTALIYSIKADSQEVLYTLVQSTLIGNEPEEKIRLSKKLESILGRIDGLHKEYMTVEFQPGEAELHETYEKAWKALEQNIHASATLVASNSAVDLQKFADLYRGDFATARQDFYKGLQALIDFHKHDAQVHVAKARSTAETSTWATIAIVAAGFLSALALGFWFASSLSKTLANVAEQLSRGAQEVSGAAGQIAASSETLSSATAEQAAAVEETSASVEELSAMVQKNADNASRSHEVSTGSSQVASRGKSSVDEMIQAIGEIDQANTDIMAAIDQSNRDISEITRVIGEIGNKTKVINDIVFQTKLLSFNASVEAARAGEHGKGFAVVAEEVGNLAQMSGNAAKEISTMLDESIQKVESIVNTTKVRVESLIHKGRERVVRGRDVAERCGEILGEVVGNVTNVGSMVSEISSASQEQAQGIKEITRAITQMDQVTQENASASQTTASASVELAGQAETLRTMVAELERLVRGGQALAGNPNASVAQVPVQSGPASSKILHLKTAARTKAKTPSPELRKVANGGAVPSGDHPGFGEE